MRRRTYLIAAAFAGILVVATAAGLYFGRSTSNAPSSRIQIVAAENFWGSLVSQLSGTHGQVLSIVTDPNADPHEYESNAANARAIATADFVVVNGAGYDDWALRLIAANGNQHQKVLIVADLLGKKPGDNPHFWYSPTYTNLTLHAMYSDLVSIDAIDGTYYRQQYTSLNVSLGAYNLRIRQIASNFEGRPVASTESIFEYLADATRLNLISPVGFTKAVSEGNDPSPSDIISFQSQLRNATSPGNATVLVYNLQTVTPLTQSIQAEAAQNRIPTVAVTETIQPGDALFQDWMYAELIQLQNGLNAQALGH